MCNVERQPNETFPSRAFFNEVRWRFDMTGVLLDDWIDKKTDRLLQATFKKEVWPERILCFAHTGYSTNNFAKTVI